MVIQLFGMCFRVLSLMWRGGARLRWWGGEGIEGGRSEGVRPGKSVEVCASLVSPVEATC